MEVGIALGLLVPVGEVTGMLMVFGTLGLGLGTTTELGV